jgi:hypothetical protein
LSREEDKPPFWALDPPKQKFIYAYKPGTQQASSIYSFHPFIPLCPFPSQLSFTMAALPGVPGIYSLSDCASWSITVQPYIAQANSLPHTIYNVIKAAGTSSPQALSLLYSNTNPFVSAFAFSLFAGLIFFIVSEANKNYSQVDRMWSILPFAYLLHYDVWARQNGIASARNDFATLVFGLWSARLTFNYWRKGGYTVGSEDYRWLIVKNKIGEPAMFILNLTFISFIQSVGVLLDHLSKSILTRTRFCLA